MDPSLNHAMSMDYEQLQSERAKSDAVERAWGEGGIYKGLKLSFLQEIPHRLPSLCVSKRGYIDISGNVKVELGDRI